MKKPRCIGNRKRHYFGQNRGGGGGMALTPVRKCVWCGWDRGYIHTGYWNKLWLKAMRAEKGDNRARVTVLKETARIIGRGQRRRRRDEKDDYGMGGVRKGQN